MSTAAHDESHDRIDDILDVQLARLRPEADRLRAALLRGAVLPSPSGSQRTASPGARPPDKRRVVGDVVNTAARLQSIAPVNGAVVGEPTWRATRAQFDFEGPEPVKVKGKAASLAIWRVVAARGRVGASARPGPSAPFIGRDDELTLLDRHFARVLDEVHLAWSRTSERPASARATW